MTDDDESDVRGACAGEASRQDSPHLAVKFREKDLLYWLDWISIV